MKRSQVEMVRHIVQHHLNTQKRVVLDLMVVDLEMDWEEIEAWDVFCGEVASRVLDRLWPKEEDDGDS